MLAVTIRTPEGVLAIGETSGPGTVYLTVSPREITLFRTPPEGSAQNVFGGVVLEIVPGPPGGERIRVVLNTRPMLVAEVTREAVAALSLREGMRVYAAFKATGVQLHAYWTRRNHVQHQGEQRLGRLQPGHAHTIGPRSKG